MMISLPSRCICPTSVYRKTYEPAVSLRFSLRNLKKQDDGLINIPLFMVDYTRKLLNLAGVND